jgi:hypothetical protein
MKEAPDRWPVRVIAAMAFAVAVAVLVLVALALFLNSHPFGWD